MLVSSNDGPSNNWRLIIVDCHFASVSCSQFSHSFGNSILREHKGRIANNITVDYSAAD